MAILSIESVNKALSATKRSTSFRPKFHFTPVFGRLCEPCDIIYEDKKYMLYYTINPNIKIYGPLYWGVTSSYNFLNFRDEAICLAPNQKYDNDSCKGGSVVKDGKNYLLFYTGSNNDDGEIIETIDMAQSNDGFNFEKLADNPIINEAPPQLNASSSFFRHPMVFKYKDTFLMAVASRVKRKPVILFYKSFDGKEWVYINYAYANARFGTIWEHPNIYIDNNDNAILIFSAVDSIQKKESYQNGRRVFYSTFSTDALFKSQKAIYLRNVHLMDYGSDFYGPSIYRDGKNTYIVGLINAWYSVDVASILKLPYSGVLSLPRKMTLKNGIIYQEPLSSNVFMAKRRTTMQISIDREDRTIKEIIGNSQHFTLVFNVKAKTCYSLKVFKNGPFYLEIAFDSKKNKWSIDRSHARYPFINKEDNPNDIDVKNFYCSNTKVGDELSIDIYVDVTTLELFINNGEFTATSLYYSESEDVDLTISTSTPTTARILVEHFK